MTCFNALQRPNGSLMCDKDVATKDLLPLPRLRALLDVDCGECTETAALDLVSSRLAVCI